MAIHTDWLDNNKDTLITEISGAWTWQDVQNNAQRVHSLAMSVNYPVGLIVFLPNTLSLPPSGFAQSSRDIIANHMELELHTIVYVSVVPYTQTLWRETLNAMANDPSRYFVVSDGDKAVDIVRSRQP